MERLADIARRDDEVDILEVEILDYLARLRQGSLSEEESREFQGLMMAADNMESLADVVETDLVALGRKIVDISASTGEETRELLLELYTMVYRSVEMMTKAVRDNDQRAAESVMLMKDDVRELSERLATRKAQRLTADDRDYLELVRLEMSFVDHMRRIYTLSKRIVKVILPPALAQRA